MDDDRAPSTVDLFMQVSREFAGVMHTVAVRHELTPMQTMALVRVGAEQVPTKEIARHLHCDPSNATGLVDQLERRELVRRITPQHDRRVRAVETTARGRKVLGDIRSAMADRNTVLRTLSDRDHAELRRILQLLLAAGEASAAERGPHSGSEGSASGKAASGSG
ncbi:MAG: MarR family winged helix-turn-helix transcriptional regulator [Phycicoccus sp.]